MNQWFTTGFVMGTGLEPVQLRVRLLSRDELEQLRGASLHDVAHRCLLEARNLRINEHRHAPGGGLLSSRVWDPDVRNQADRCRVLAAWPWLAGYVSVLASVAADDGWFLALRSGPGQGALRSSPPVPSPVQVTVQFPDELKIRVVEVPATETAVVKRGSKGIEKTQTVMSR